MSETQKKVIFTAPATSGYHDNATWYRPHRSVEGIWLKPGERIAVLPPDTEIAPEINDHLPNPLPKRYTYLVIDAELCYAFHGPKMPDSYMAMHDQAKLLVTARDGGYRWVRTDYTGNGTGKAIWEKEWTT